MTKSNNYSRFADWDKNVLAKVGDVAQLNEIRTERSRQINGDSDESSIVRECIMRNIINSHKCPDKGHYLIPVGLIATWILEVKAEKATPLKVSAYLKTLGIAELQDQIRRSDGMYWVWRGPKCPEGSTPQSVHSTIPDLESATPDLESEF